MNDDRAQVHVIEALLVAGLALVVIAMTAVFRLPTTPSTFQQAELERLGAEALLALLAKPPQLGIDCNEPSSKPCPFENELERMLSLALGYEGPTSSASGEPRDTTPFDDFLTQSFPEGALYVLSYTNGINDTTIHPLGRVPPRLDVVVARALVAPNWTVQAKNLTASPVIRIGEITGFTDATTDKIFDPLNRPKEEWGRTHKSLLSNAGGTAVVPNSALYGTYRLCPASGSCQNFTIVPAGVFGAGAPILPGDRDNSTNIRSLGDLYSLAKFRDNSPSDDALSSGERIYLDLDAPGTNQVSVGDLRLSRVPSCVGSEACLAGSRVQSGDSDIGHAIEAFGAGSQPPVRALLGNDDAKLDEGEWVYLDVNNDRVVNAGDRRLHRVATFLFGSEVVGGDLDAGKTLVAAAQDFTAYRVVYSDVDNDNTLDAGEPLYLDLEGNGLRDGLESLDIHISPKGSPTVRYAYDVKVVVWYGV